MFKILNFIESIIGELFVIDRRFRREFDDEIRLLFKVVQTVEFDDWLIMRNGKPLSCHIVLENDSKLI